MSKTLPTASVPPDAGSTASTLLDTAEHLFARSGIDNVSLRQIASESGHGNRSGALYHFGSREALIRKLLERRMEVVDALRHKRLNELVAARRDDDLAAIVGCAINVLAEVLREYSWGPDYVLVVAQALANPRIRLISTIDARAVSGHTRTVEMLRRLLPQLPPDRFEARMETLRHEAVGSFARWLHENGALTEANQGNFNAMVANVADFLSAGISAPVTAAVSASPATPVALKQIQTRRGKAIAT